METPTESTVGVDESFASRVGGGKARFSGLTLPLELLPTRPKTAVRNRLREDIDDAPTGLPLPATCEIPSKRPSRAALFDGAGHPSCRVTEPVKT